jgi:DNA-binding response OmpR family regulator
MKTLIIEDDHNTAQFFFEAAHSQGLEDVDIVPSAEEALEQILNTSYDLITLDVHLPGASGLEILSALRAMCPSAIIAIISGHLPGDIEPSTAECADVMLEKPVSVKTLCTLLNNVKQIHIANHNIRALENRSTEE